MSAAAVIALRRKSLVRPVREAGVTDPEHAVTLEALGERSAGVVRQMVRCGAFLATPDGRFCSDDAAATACLDRRRVRTVMGGGICLLLLPVVLLVLLLSRLFGR